MPNEAGIVEWWNFALEAAAICCGILVARFMSIEVSLSLVTTPIYFNPGALKSDL